MWCGVGGVALLHDTATFQLLRVPQPRRCASRHYFLEELRRYFVREGR